MDELDTIAADPLGSPAPVQTDLHGARTHRRSAHHDTCQDQRWEPRDHGNGLPYRLWDALSIVHAVASEHRITEADAVHAVQAAVRQIKTDDDVIDLLSEHLGELGVDSLKDFMGRTIELETHYPLNLGAYALSVVDSDTMQAPMHGLRSCCEIGPWQARPPLPSPPPPDPRRGLAVRASCGPVRHGAGRLRVRGLSA